MIAGAAVDGVRALLHGSTEDSLSLDQYHDAVDAARRAFLRTFGKEEFTKATGCKKVAGCKYDDSQLPEEFRTKPK
jgi:hypothetical protein